MKKADLIRFGKQLKNIIKCSLPEEKHYVSYCRKIEKIKTEKKICAMTFDDGPTSKDAITESILDTLKKYSAKGTFDIIGTTENNYPDVCGKAGTPSWGGVSYDHYPCFHDDQLAGAANCEHLVSRIINEGHEITNHTFSHVLFGKKNLIYSSRNTFNSFEKVYEDVNKLDLLLKEKYNYSMKFSRPPHYVDKINGGFNSYDVYSLIGYNYLSASFDGAGWLPLDTEKAEIEAMTVTLKESLERDPYSLCGQIIFQKDGYNMSLRAPVKSGLEHQLKLLKEYDYKIVTVSELLSESPFSDIGRDDVDFDLFNKLISSKAIAFNDNTLQPDALMTRGELAMFLAPKEEAVNNRINAIKIKNTKLYSISNKHPYSGAMIWAINNRLLKPINGKAAPGKILNITDFNKLENFFDIEKLKDVKLTRRNILKSYIFD